MGRRKAVQAFLDPIDLAALFAWFSEDPEVAFLWHDKGARADNLARDDIPSALVRASWSRQQERQLEERVRRKRWRAYERLEPQGDSKYLLWHIPSGPVKRRDHSRSKSEYLTVDTPFAGWESESFLNAPDAPWVGDEPRFVFVDVNAGRRLKGCTFGLTLVHVHGSDWAAAPKPMKVFWRRTQRFIESKGVEIRVRSDEYDSDSTFLAWPGACSFHGMERVGT